MQNRVLAKHFQEEEYTVNEKSHVNDSLKYWIEFMLFALLAQQQIFSSI